MTLHLLSWLLALASAPEAIPFHLPAPVEDVVSAADEIWFLTQTSEQRTRSAYRISPGGKLERVSSIPELAIGVDVCLDADGKWTPVFVGATGLFSANGETQMAGDFLIPVIDPNGLMAIPVCDDDGKTWLLFTKSGMRIRQPNGEIQDIPMPPDVRAFSGQRRQGFRNLPTYGAAFSLYLPRFELMDTDGDGKSDLVVRRQNSFAIFHRDEKGLFSSAPLILNFTRDLGVSPSTTAHPIWVDANADGNAELLVALTEGISTERTRLLGWSRRANTAKFVVRELPSRAGLWLPVAPIRREQSAGLLMLSIDTGLSALASSLLTGEIAMNTWIFPSIDATPVPSHTFHPRMELRGEKRIGVQPIASLDLDNDGRADLIDLSEEKMLVWYRGERDRFSKSTSGRIPVIRFSQHFVLPKSNSLVLLAEPKDGRNAGMWIRGTPGQGAQK